MSSIKLTADSGGGTFEIKAPSSSGNTRILTLPDTENLTLGKTGILQVVQTVKTDITSTTSSTFAAISGLSVNITPSASSSTILVTVDCKIGNGGGLGAYIRLQRGNSVIYAGTGGGEPVLQQTYGGSDTGEGLYGSPFMGGTFLDSPAVDTQLTYAVYWARENSGTLYLNRTGSNSGAYVGNSASSITVMEVAA
tara:strand:- start:174 stop:758 length:585 start_codon:yes stop_codon:yes gene_type:complete